MGLLKLSLISTKKVIPQPAHLKDTNNTILTYYKPVYKEKYKYDGPNGAARLLRRARDSIDGKQLFSGGRTTANTAETGAIKSYFNSIVSNKANIGTMDIKDFYLGTSLPAGKEYT